MDQKSGYLVFCLDTAISDCEKNTFLILDETFIQARYILYYDQYWLIPHLHVVFKHQMFFFIVKRYTFIF